MNSFQFISKSCTHLLISVFILVTQRSTKVGASFSSSVAVERRPLREPVELSRDRLARSLRLGRSLPDGSGIATGGDVARSVGEQSTSSSSSLSLSSSSTALTAIILLLLLLLLLLLVSLLLVIAATVNPLSRLRERRNPSDSVHNVLLRGVTQPRLTRYGPGRSRPEGILRWTNGLMGSG